MLNNMYCNEKLKLNKLVQVRIPSNQEYFARFGLLALPPDSNFSGDNSVSLNMSKMERIIEANNAYNEFAASFDNEND